MSTLLLIIVEERQLKPSQYAQKKCRMKCHLKISEEKRASIFQHSWTDLGEYRRQQDFLESHIDVHETENKTIHDRTSRRQQSVFYYLTVDGQRIKVCREFFLCTLAETADRLRHLRETKQNVFGSGRNDKRGSHGKQKTVPLITKKQVRARIRSYPAVDGHYCRARSKRKYLPEGLNITKMYRQYETQSQELGRESVKLC